MTDDDMKFLMTIMEINIAPDDKYLFKDVLHFMPQWTLIVPVTAKYLRNIDTPVAKWKMQYTAMTPTATNHALTEYSYTNLGALYTGSTPMLLRNNILVTRKISNFEILCRLTTYYNSENPVTSRLWY